MPRPTARPKTADGLGAVLSERRRLFVEHDFRRNLTPLQSLVRPVKLTGRHGSWILQRAGVQEYMHAGMGQYMLE